MMDIENGVKKSIVIQGVKPKNELKPSAMQYKMLEYNNIQNVVIPRYEERDGEPTYIYSMPDQFQTLHDSFLFLTEKTILNILDQILRIMAECEDYFLLGNRLLLTPKTILIQSIGNHISVALLYLPVKYKFDLSEGDLFRNLSYDLISMLEKWDVAFIKTFFNTINKNHFSISQTLALLDQHLCTETTSPMIEDDYSYSNLLPFPIKQESDQPGFLSGVITKFKKMTSFQHTQVNEGFPTTIIQNLSQETITKFELIPLNGTNLQPIQMDIGINVLGRDAELAQIVLNNSRVSRKHAEFHIFDNKIQIRDLNSKNGTVLNEIRIIPNKWYAIKDNDRLNVAGNQFLIHFGDIPLQSGTNVSYN
jgi:hypothetical protein